MDKLQIAISAWHIWLGGITAEQWYVFASMVSGSGILFSIIAYIKRRQWKKYADRFEDWVINLNLWFFSTVTTLGAFIGLVVGFGVDPANFLSFLGNHAPQVFSGAVTFYAFSKQARKKLAERKAKKIHLSDELIDGIVDTPAPFTEKQPIPQVTPHIWDVK